MNKEDLSVVNITGENKKYINERLDKTVGIFFPDFSRSFVQKSIKERKITVNNSAEKCSYRLREGDVIYVNVDIYESVEPEILPENIPLDILYEDEDVIVVNKPKNMVVHPAPGHYTNTLVNALMYHCKSSLSGINGVIRPGIVHRIDKNTTGVLVACKNDRAHRDLALQLKEHSITRSYLAVVYNNFSENTGVIRTTIGRHPQHRKKMAVNVKNGKEAVTNYKVLSNLNKKYNYVECVLETGRTHQIRVHMSSVGHPLLGDDVYGPEKIPKEFSGIKIEGQTLHARKLGFIHPTKGIYMEFEAELPEYFKEILNRIQLSRRIPYL